MKRNNEPSIGIINLRNESLYIKDKELEEYVDTFGNSIFTDANGFIDEEDKKLVSGNTVYNYIKDHEKYYDTVLFLIIIAIMSIGIIILFMLAYG